MTQRGPDNPSIESGSRWDAAIDWLLIGLLAFMPFALGVVAPWSETIVIGVTGLMAACLIGSYWSRRGAERRWSWSYIPVALLLLLIVLQLIPLPRSLASALSPHTVETKTRLLQDLPNAQAALQDITLTFYPLATRHDLRIVLTATAIFIIVLHVYRRPRQITRLLAAIAVIAGAAALLALLQDVSGAGKIYWSVPTPRDRANGGPFVNYNNYSQFINLSIGAALGLLLVTLRESQAPTRRSASPFSALKGPSLGWAWGMAVVIVLGCVTLFLSLSRGGMVSMLAALGFTTLMLARRRGMRVMGWVVTVVTLVAFCGILYAGFDAVCERLATLRTSEDPSSGRFQTYKDIAVAWRRFPAFGTGLGTHEYVYPMFDRSSDPGLADYADSDYFQMAEEAGAVGLGLVLIFAAAIGTYYLKAIRPGRPAICAAAFGLGFGLLAVMLQSMTDYGQHLPAIGCLSAVFCGLLINLRRMPRSDAGAMLASAQPQNTVVPRTAARQEMPAAIGLSGDFLRFAAPVAIIAAMVWAFLGANAARRADAHSTRALLATNRSESADSQPSDSQPVDPGIEESIQEASAAVACEPTNVKLRYLLDGYRWRSVSDGVESQADPQADPQANGGAGLSLEALRATQQIVDDLHQARRLCPTYGPAYCLAGQLERLVLDQPLGTAHVRTSYELAPANPQVCFATAQLDAAEGNWDDSVAKFRRCLVLDPSTFGQIAELYIHQADRPDLLVVVAQDSPERLLSAMYTLREEAERSEREDVSDALARSKSLLKAQGAGADTGAWMLVTLANLSREDKDYDSAAEFYRRALKKDYGQVDWHYALAEVLAERGHTAEAIEQAEICLRLRPQMDAAKRLVGDISVGAVRGRQDKDVNVRTSEHGSKLEGPG